MRDRNNVDVTRAFIWTLDKCGITYDPDIPENKWNGVVPFADDDILLLVACLDKDRGNE